MLVPWLKQSFTTGGMLFPCWVLDLRTLAAVQIDKNGTRKPVYKMKTDISFFLRCSVSWALLEYFPRQDTYRISLLYLKEKSVIGQWSAIKRKRLLWQAMYPLGTVFPAWALTSGNRGAGCSHPCAGLSAWGGEAASLPASRTVSQVEG